MIKALRSENKIYDDKITLVYVDWNQHRGSPLSKQHGVGRRSTLVLLRGTGELGRVVAQTSTAAIKALLDKAL